MSRIKNGYDWEKIFKRSFLKTFESNAFIYKLIDTHAVEGLIALAKKQNSKMGEFVVPKVPSDYICIVDGKCIFVECKNTTKDVSFPLQNIKDHQLEFATQIEEAGGKYFFAIRRQEPRNHECFLLTVNDIIRLKLANDNRKSIKFEQMREDKKIKQPKWVKGARFDMSPLMKD